jgi:DNA-binding transcriptional ArsR family regulator
VPGNLDDEEFSMSVKMMTWAFEARGLTPVERLILLALADWANDDGECWPGQVSIAEKVEVSESTVRRAIRRLEAAEVIEVGERRRPDGYRTSNLYRLGGLPVNLTGSDSHRSNVTNLTGQIGTPSPVTGDRAEPLVEPPEEPPVHTGKRATQKQIDLLAELWRESGRWPTDDIQAEWHRWSVALADNKIRELKRERKRHA